MEYLYRYTLPSGKNICASSCVSYGILASVSPRRLQVSPRRLQVSPSVSQCLLVSSGLAVFLLGANFQNTQTPRDTLRIYPRIHPIPNNHFLGFFPDVTCTSNREAPLQLRSYKLPACSTSVSIKINITMQLGGARQVCTHWQLLPLSAPVANCGTTLHLASHRPLCSQGHGNPRIWSCTLHTSNRRVLCLL